MNTHRTMIHGKCPINGNWDYYEVVFTTKEFMTAEDVEDRCDHIRGLQHTQERLADRLRLDFPDHVGIELTGRHTSNTTTTCKR